ncbi:ABC transporter permease [Symbiobacterium thermophilum]|uniref:ABC transporter permease n=1 Tax=Symbiobacterium thermophilum TaxID=2734 RepID=UPI0035C76BAC
MRKRTAGLLWGLLGIGASLVAWHLAARRYPPWAVPTSVDVARELVRLAGEGALLQAVAVTTVRTLSGFGLAVLLGGVSGLLAGLLRPLGQALAPVVTAVQGVPPVALIIVALLWFDANSTAPVFTIAVAVLPIIFAAALEGTRSVDRGLIEMATVFRTPRRMLVTEVYLPHLLSYLFPALVSGLGLAWKVALLAELMAGSRSGMGAGLGAARVNLNVAGMFAWIAVVVILLLVMENLVLRPLKRRLEPWQRGREGGGG